VRTRFTSSDIAFQRRVVADLDSQIADKMGRLAREQRILVAMTKEGSTRA